MAAVNGFGRLKRGHVLPLLLWTVLWGIYFGTLLLGIDRLPNGDFSGQFHAFSLFQAREMIDGRLPIWSSGSFAGFPFAADPQSAVFYPPRWLTVLLSSLGSFTYYALTLEALFHVWLAGVFTYWLAFDLTDRRGPALFAAIAFGLGGYVVSYPIQQLAILETMAWLPLILLLLRRSVLPGSTARPLLAAAVIMGVAVLAGHPQSLLHIGYLAAAYYLFLTRRARWGWRTVLGWGALFTVIAAGIAMAATLPAARYALETTRDAVTYEFVSTGFPLLDFLQVVVPGALTVWSPQYIGLAGFTLAVLAWFGRRESGRDDLRSEIVFWSVTAVVAAWLSLGDNGIIFELVYRIAPGVSLFRQQERLAGIFSLSLALLAAQGLAIWLRSRELEDSPGDSAGFVRSTLWLTGGFLVLAGVTLAAARMIANAGWWTIWLRQGLLLAFIVVSLSAWRRRPRNGLVALTLLLVIDLFLATRPTMGLIRESPSVFWPEPAWLQTLRADGPGRIDSQNLFHANVGEIYSLEDIRGISPLKPQIVEQFEALPRRLRWQLLNVTHVIAPEQLEEGLTPIASVVESIIPGDPIAATLYRFDDALPRAWLSNEVLFAQDASEVLALMQRPDFDPARQVVLPASDAAAADEVLPAADRGEVQEQVQPGGARSFEIETSVPTVLVISEWFRPGWRAKLANGESLSILVADGGLMAVPVPAGRHELHLEYQPWEVPVGVVVSLFTLLACLVLIRRRPSLGPRPAGDKPIAVGERGPSGSSAGRDHQLAAERWLLVLILLLGFGLRVYRLGDQELRGDEAFSFNFTRLPLNNVVSELIDQGDPHPPLHYLILNVWADMAGVSEFALRYLSVIAGTLLPAVLYTLGRRMSGRTTGIIAAALSAIAPGLIWLGQDVRNQYVLVMLFASLATLILTTFPRKHPIVYWGLYLVACILTVYSHYFGAFALGAHGLYLWFTPGRRRDLVKWLACGIGTLLVLGVWLAGSAQSLLQAGQLGDPSRPDLARHVTAIGRDLTIGQSLNHSLDRWLFLVAMILVLVGGVALVRTRRSNWAAMLLAWLTLGIYAIYLVRFSRGTFNAFYGSVVAPAWWLLLSTGLIWLWRQGRWRRVAAVLAPLVLAVAVVVALGNYYFDPRFSRTLGYRDVTAHLAEHADPDDIFVVPFPDPVWDYYLRDSSIPRLMLPATWAETAAETEAALAALAETRDQLWFVPYTGWDRENTVKRWLDYHTLHEERSVLGRTELRAYRPLTSAGVVMTPIDRWVDDEIRLAGAYVSAGGIGVDPSKAIPLSPGEPLEVTLLWESIGATDRSLTVFAHLLDASGNLIAQHDGLPVEGTRPTTTWNPGERLMDRHGLLVPDATTGPARLVVGLYDSETVERQTFEGGLLEIPIADFIIAPVE